jgi:hypothetical protein
MDTVEKSSDRKRGGKRRGPGEGSVFKLHDGRWRGQILLGYKNGTARYKTFEAKTRASVQDKLAANLHLRQQGIEIAPEKLKLGEYLQRWLKDCVRARARDSTFKSYTELVEQHIIPGLGNVLLQKLTALHIQSFLNEQREAGNVARKGALSPRTVQYLHAILKNALAQATKWIWSKRTWPNW